MAICKACTESMYSFSYLIRIFITINYRALFTTRKNEISRFVYNSLYSGNIENINIVAYEPAFGIIGDPAKRTPKTRQSADHSMVYIVSTILRKAFENKAFNSSLDKITNLDEVWKTLML